MIQTNAFLVAAQFANAGAGAAGVARQQVIHHAMLLQTKVKANASGRPGPNAPTGDYRRSISRKTMASTAAGTTSHVGTNAPQGRRLEFGFTGADSLGRFYDQPPYPHFGPAVDDIADVFEQSLADAIERLLT